jgi:hypothetical protein
MFDIRHAKGTANAPADTPSQIEGNALCDGFAPYGGLQGYV